MQLLFWLLFFILPVCQGGNYDNCTWHAGPAVAGTDGAGYDTVSVGTGDDKVTIYGPLHYSDGRTNYDVRYTISFGSLDNDNED
jgi:hypothetical protein